MVAVGVVVASLTPAAALADTANSCANSPQQFVTCLKDAILAPLMVLLFGAALFLFAWGIVEFLWGLSSGSENKEKGKQHMLWGVIGLAIMTGAYAIIQMTLNTFNITTFH